MAGLDISRPDLIPFLQYTYTAGGYGSGSNQRYERDRMSRPTGNGSVSAQPRPPAPQKINGYQGEGNRGGLLAFTNGGVRGHKIYVESWMVDNCSKRRAISYKATQHRLTAWTPLSIFYTPISNCVISIAATKSHGRYLLSSVSGMEQPSSLDIIATLCFHVLNTLTMA